jgi:ribosomal protein S18 acetylase RimI-like enzyme
MGMAQAETLVSMRRNKAMSPAALAPIDGLTLHSGDLGDVAGMTAIDQAAFVPPFQMTALDMRYAYRGSTLCTVARLHGEMVGYQISTRHGLVGHLARLAVAPALHGRGIGAALVREMIAAFGRRQIESVTVNTQRSNTRSQHLYHGFGFEHTHHDVPMFRTVL